MYLLRTRSFNNIWWRVENRVSELAVTGHKFDKFQLGDILRSFAKGNEKQMTGSKKLFTNLEPQVLESIDSMGAREYSHVLYAYSVRNLGNPELYKAFDNKL